LTTPLIAGDNGAMGGSRLERVVLGAVLLLISCGGSLGQTTDGGNGSGGTGSKGAGGTGGQAAGTGGSGGQVSGTGGSGASCPAVAPCGGNIVGTWKVTQSCVTATEDFSSAGAACTGASAVLQITYGGSLTYNADLTYDYSAVTASEVVHEYFPNGCGTAELLTCQQLGQAVMDAGTGRCSTDAQGDCTCDYVKMLTSTDPTGAYTVSGNKLTTTSSQTMMPSSSSYCVQGSVLYLIPDSSPDGGLSATGELVLTKQ
jgi:hypothetical protein